MNKRNINIELLRIVACIFVITIHLAGTYVCYGGNIHKGVLVIDSMVRGAVPLFFMISGYFLDSAKSIKKQYIKFLVNIICPTLVIVLFSGILIPFLLNRFLGMSEEIPTLCEAIKLIVSGRISEFKFCFHLWYIVELIKCYIFLPVLQCMCTQEEHMQRVRRYILFIGIVAAIALPSVELIYDNVSFGIFSYMPITISMWYMLLGYEMKIWFFTHIKKHKYIYVGGVLFIIGEMGTFFFTYYNEYLIDFSSSGLYYNYWFIFILLEVMGVFVVINSLVINVNSSLIEQIGKCTFGIYLVHPIVYSIIWHLHIDILISVVGIEIFLVVFILITFFLSFVMIYWLQRFFDKIVVLLKKETCLK